MADNEVTCLQLCSKLGSNPIGNSVMSDFSNTRPLSSSRRHEDTKETNGISGL